MAHFHAITVEKFARLCPIRKTKFRFVLMNNGVICGDRLFKGDDDSRKNGMWPFRATNQDWMFHDDHKTALAAAEKLQKYLDAREASKAKKGKNNAA